MTNILPNWSVSIETEHLGRSIDPRDLSNFIEIEGFILSCFLGKMLAQNTDLLHFWSVGDYGLANDISLPEFRSKSCKNSVSFSFNKQTRNLRFGQNAMSTI